MAAVWVPQGEVAPAHWSGRLGRELGHSFPSGRTEEKEQRGRESGSRERDGGQWWRLAASSGPRRSSVRRRRCSWAPARAEQGIGDYFSVPASLVFSPPRVRTMKRE